METIKLKAEDKIREVLDELFEHAQVFQGGGSEIQESDLLKALREAAENALQRLYPQFGAADHTGWQRVCDLAKKGVPDALKAVDYDGDLRNNSICKAILSYIASGKKGVEIHDHFKAAPYGWSQDAIQGALQVLLIAGNIQARDERNQTIDPSKLERKAIGKTIFKVESATLSSSQRIAIRKVFQKLEINSKPGEEGAVVTHFLNELITLADNASGDVPSPLHPDLSFLDAIRQAAGNEQLLAIYNQQDELKTTIEAWKVQSKKISERLPEWKELQQLLKYSKDLEIVKNVKQQVEAIETHRLLITDPNPIQPLLRSLEDALRQEIDSQQMKYTSERERHLKELEKNVHWKQLTEEKCMEIQRELKITPISKISLGTHQELLGALEQFPLSSWKDRIDALSSRFYQARDLAVSFLAPKTQTIELPRCTLTTTDEVQDWMNNVHELLKIAVVKGPVIVQ